MAENIFEKRYQTGHVLRAAGVTNDQLQSWIRRTVIVGVKGQAVEMPGSPGIKRGYSFRTVMQIAVAKALTDMGVPGPQAFRAALIFSHTGDASRVPGLPHKDGPDTLLCVSSGDAVVVQAKAEHACLSHVRWALKSPDAFVTVATNPVFDRVCDALDMHPEDALKEAYDT